MPTPSSTSRHSRAPTGSPPLSTIGSQAYTLGAGIQSLRVVTRLAIEGKAKHGQDGASMRMYLRISLPIENAIPGSTIALFPEENIKILDSQVHPLDNTSAPYNFSSSTSPLLQNAARALNLPSRSTQTYMSLFNLSYTNHPHSLGSSSRTPSANGSYLPILDEKYTGHILVSGYNVSYVLPREFPPRQSVVSLEDDGTQGRGSPYTSMRSRRGSVGERNAYQFMAAIDTWIPLSQKPPRAPFHLRVPVPRCLSNTIKLRIAPPPNTSASFASLSSAEDDQSSWDLTSEPHVTRSVSRHSRSSSYGFSQFADDESSDASAGFSEGSGLQGTFPSTERLSIRWASPLRATDVPGVTNDGRRRAGVESVESKMMCTVLGKGKAPGGDTDGIVVNVEYSAECKNVWFGGVASMLGLDVGMDSKDCDISWAEGSEPRWTITGGTGFTGWDAGEEKAPASREPSLLAHQAPGIQETPRSRVDSTGSSASLLRQPLPGHAADSSFDSSVLGTPASSLGSLPLPSPGLERSLTPNGVDTTLDIPPRVPSAPITIHINMNDLLPPPNQPKNSFSFQIHGVLLVTPRTPSVPDSPAAVSLPRFRILAADAENLTMHLRNDSTSTTVEVYTPEGDLRDAQTRRTVLQRGMHTRCGRDGVRVALRAVHVSPFGYPDSETSFRDERAPSQPVTPMNRRRSSSVASEGARRVASVTRARPKRDGQLIIPEARVVVTPLSVGQEKIPDAYAVRVTLSAPSEDDAPWLEFGLPRPSASERMPRLQVVSASVDGVPVRFEAPVAEDQDGPALGLSSVPDDRGAEKRAPQWLSWVRVRTSGATAGQVVVDYIVRLVDAELKSDALRGTLNWHLLVPAFALPLGRLEVLVEELPSGIIPIVSTNLTHELPSSKTIRLLHFGLSELHQPRITLSGKATARSTLPSLGRVASWVWHILPLLLSLLLLLSSLAMQSDLQNLKRQPEPVMPPLPTYITQPVETMYHTITVTATHYTQPPWASDEPVPPAAEPPAPSPSEPPVPSTSSSMEKATPEPSPPLKTKTTIVLPTPTATSSAPPYEPTEGHKRETGLMPIYHHLPWTLKLEWDLPTKEEVSQVVLKGLGVVWQAFRKAYHYPLDPP